MDVHPCAKYIRIVCFKKTADDFSIITIAKYIADLRVQEKGVDFLIARFLRERPFI
jgi:hypothetical protein